MDDKQSLSCGDISMKVSPQSYWFHCSSLVKLIRDSFIEYRRFIVSRGFYEPCQTKNCVLSVNPLDPRKKLLGGFWNLQVCSN